MKNRLASIAAVLLCCGAALAADNDGLAGHDRNWTSMSTVEAITSITGPTNLVITTKSGKITISLIDGAVTRDPGVSDDDAARTFWDAIASRNARCAP